MEKNVILVIDDNEMNLQIAKMILEKNFQCQVLVANNGFEGLDILRHKYISLVLLDIVMPEFSGIETLEEIRADKNLQDIPVIMLTASVDKENIKKSRELGVTDYIRKPFLPEELVKRVSKKIISVENILVIDEHESNLEKMKDILENNFSYKVITAYSAAEGIESLRQNKISLVMASSDMKFLDGFKIIEFMANDKKFNEIPFVLSEPDNIAEMIDKIKNAESVDSVMTSANKKKVVNIVTNIIGYNLKRRT